MAKRMTDAQYGRTSRILDKAAMLQHTKGRPAAIAFLETEAANEKSKIVRDKLAQVIERHQRRMQED